MDITVEQMKAACSDTAIRNRISLDRGELVLRHDKFGGAWFRVLFLDCPAEEGGEDLRVEVQLTPPTGLTRQEDIDRAWDDLRSGRLFLRSATLGKKKDEQQYRMVLAGSPVYQELYRTMVPNVGSKDAMHLLSFNFLPHIDWRLFLRDDINVGSYRYCDFRVCKQPIANLHARLNRASEARTPWRRNYA